MQNVQQPLPVPAPSGWRTWLAAHAVLVYCTVTVLLTVAALLLPLPVLAGPMLVVFFPMLASTLLIALTEGGRQVRQQLFSRAAWSASLKWVLVSLGVALLLRLTVVLLGLVFFPEYSFQPGLVTPLLLITFIFAAGEEIGWRGYALPRLLRSRSPLAAALLLGLPWALLHLPLTLPGKLSAGTPPAAQFLILMSLSVLLTWVYLGAGGSLLAATLLHGGQNALAILNDGLSVAESSWLMAVVYMGAALLVVLATRGLRFERQKVKDSATLSEE